MFYLFTSNNLEKLRMNPFKGLIEEELERFEKRLDEVLVADVDLAHDIARYMSTLKGKRLRPALALLSGQAAGLQETNDNLWSWFVEIVRARLHEVPGPPAN